MAAAAGDAGAEHRPALRRHVRPAGLRRRGGAGEGRRGGGVRALRRGRAGALPRGRAPAAADAPRAVGRRARAQHRRLPAGAAGAEGAERGALQVTPPSPDEVSPNSNRQI